jgi:hypothetical protein
MAKAEDERRIDIVTGYCNLNIRQINMYAHKIYCTFNTVVTSQMNSL